MEGYKKVIKSRKIRLLILKFLKIIPTKLMLKIQYKLKTGRRLNLRKPLRYTEKLQLYKMKYRNPLLHILTDKEEVKNFIKKIGLSKILIETYGVYSKYSEINFETLPKSFVVKSTNGGGGNQVFLIKDKYQYDFKKLEKQIKSWPKKTSSRDAGREWCYGGLKTKILIEKHLPKDKNNDIVDYKFFCFNGKVHYIDVIENRNFDEESYKGTLTKYDENFNKTNYTEHNFKKNENKINKPVNFDLMKQYAEKLSKGFPHVRVDLYNIDGEIYFGEMTFYDSSGYALYDPDDYDYILGDLLDVKSFKRSKKSQDNYWKGKENENNNE